MPPLDKIELSMMKNGSELLSGRLAAKNSVVLDIISKLFTELAGLFKNWLKFLLLTYNKASNWVLYKSLLFVTGIE